MDNRIVKCDEFKRRTEQLDYTSFIKDLNEHLLFSCHEFIKLENDKLIRMYQYAVRDGRRFRPLSLLAGSLISDSLRSESTLEAAVIIELIHKYSLLIDDCVDRDIYRRGSLTFYRKYGNNNQQAMSAYLFSIITKKLSNIRSIMETHCHKNMIMDMFQEILSDMSVGFIVDLNNETEMKSEEINDLISTTIIRNSICIGYLIATDNDTYNENVYRHLTELGEMLGRLFQTLNDLEMFISEDQQIALKGRPYSDISDGRNNVIVSMIPKEERGFLAPSDIVSHARERGVINKAVEEIKKQITQIDFIINHLPNSKGKDLFKLYFGTQKREINSLLTGIETGTMREADS